MNYNKTISLLIIIASLFICKNTFSQIIVTGTVKGTCIDGKLEGAIVKTKGGKSIVKTNKKGYYSIRCHSSKDTLVFSYIGYKPYFQRIGTQKIMNVTLVDDIKNIEEVTKVGYGVQPKDDVTGKPVIYLYPQKEMNISVKINYSGIFQTTYPLYNNGWNIHAFPNGDIINIADGKEYSYLFWDGLTNYTIDQTTYDNGYVISSDTALTFLQNILPKMGLKPREYNEFIVYWLPFLQANRLTFVHFRTGEDYNIISKNEVSPIPDTQIRVFMEFKAVDVFFKINSQTFLNLNRQGFTLVEWGGSMLKKDIKVKDDNGVFITR